MNTNKRVLLLLAVVFLLCASLTCASNNKPTKNQSRMKGLTGPLTAKKQRNKQRKTSAALKAGSRYDFKSAIKLPTSKHQKQISPTNKPHIVFTGGGIRAALGAMIFMYALEGWINVDPSKPQFNWEDQISSINALSGGGWGTSALLAYGGGEEALKHTVLAHCNDNQLLKKKSKWGYFGSTEFTKGKKVLKDTGGVAIMTKDKMHTQWRKQVEKWFMTDKSDPNLSNIIDQSLDKNPLTQMSKYKNKFPDVNILYDQCKNALSVEKRAHDDKRKTKKKMLQQTIGELPMAETTRYFGNAAKNTAGALIPIPSTKERSIMAAGYIKNKQCVYSTDRQKDMFACYTRNGGKKEFKCNLQSMKRVPRLKSLKTVQVAGASAKNIIQNELKHKQSKNGNKLKVDRPLKFKDMIAMTGGAYAEAKKDALGILPKGSLEQLHCRMMKDYETERVKKNGEIKTLNRRANTKEEFKLCDAGVSCNAPVVPIYLNMKSGGFEKVIVLDMSGPDLAASKKVMKGRQQKESVDLTQDLKLCQQTFIKDWKATISKTEPSKSTALPQNAAKTYLPNLTEQDLSKPFKFFVHDAQNDKILEILWIPLAGKANPDKYDKEKYIGTGKKIKDLKGHGTSLVSHYPTVAVGKTWSGAKGMSCKNVKLFVEEYGSALEQDEWFKAIESMFK